MIRTFVNIPSSNNSNCYAYKMPSVDVSFEGSGMRTVTSFKNIGDIAQTLMTSPETLFSFICSQLGAEDRIRNKKYLINGKYAYDVMQMLVDKFILTFILCTKCKLPETRRIIKQSRLFYQCQACGNKREETCKVYHKLFSEDKFTKIKNPSSFSNKELSVNTSQPSEYNITNKNNKNYFISMESTKMLNIPSSVKDPNYRYKMPKIVAVVQGSGGNTKTKLENIKEVAHALTVPPDYPLKFIGKELGSQTDVKNDNYLINGNHTADKMQQLLDKFIEKYVLCPKCKLPETRIFIKKSEIRCKCRACGGISKLDDKHKFSNHIKNFPPKYDEEVEKTPVVDDDGKKAGKTSQSNKIVLDKEMKIKIKTCIDKISKLVEEHEANSDSSEDLPSKISGVLVENKLEMHSKYFVLVNGVFDKNVYSSQLSRRIPIVKNILDREEENHKQEAIFHIIAALADFTTNRFKDLARFVSSILYYFYAADIITEDFWIKYAIKNSISSSNSPFLTQEIETNFLDHAKEFSHWIEYAPYEDETDKTYQGMNSREEPTPTIVKSQPIEDVDIDNI